ncbi:hypothetical protein IV203_003412 [Nitzschia inconspicua]|uniref:Uncharacterized protein n=1 Tax=Nitzschia inconspicua TaxID=303405 RepID=A0A9K3PP83_9STRA|nr:hypothetical protein IV203_003412 [Nitzschia inconspicua]
MTNDTTECVGTLLVPSSNLKELSAATNNDVVECVGSLLVHTSDVQELSSMSVASTLPTVNLRQRVTAGTLLVKSDDLRSPDQERNTENNVSFRKRLTKRLNGPAPADEEADSWAD